MGWSPGKSQFDSRQGNLEAWLFRQNGDSWRFDEPVPTVEYWKYEKDELAAFPGMFELSGQVEIAFAGSEVVYLRVDLQTREPVFAEWGWLRHREKLNLEMMEKYRKTVRYQQQLKLWTRIREEYSGIEAPAEFRGEFKLERRYELPV
jgi:hypothetical protein